MIADDVRRPYPHPYQVTSRGERHLPPPPAGTLRDRVATASERPAAQPDERPAERAPERTVHRLHHIRLVSDQAISVIDHVLEHAS
ncbi:hypothetical protein ACWGH8_06640 [Nonomuraea muscovyensis]|jgi:hypothetical protein|uniref:Uncharacterized protein n=1 Tax=Nonomuraea muscovyensis TaxID=1124761 RepID=A0A7X0C867_9ACTN|nr:hypothetical protein [Nonomuraea muscovyensis]MBB6349411.1 hypothetical protein [Nonomuraea muscovyensis]MDF2705728.1 hypothetical protein [Nonomuraea muscovyensis]